MPTSDTAQISTILDLIQILNPKSLLDIGCGWGKYGFLSREYLMGMYWDKNTVLIEAVEGYEKNINSLQWEIYNNVYICNALDFDKYLKREYDLILLIDVFEHFSKEDGIKVIKKLREKSKNLLISIPRYVTIQKGYSDDAGKFEEHRAFWTRKMFKEFGNCIIVPNNARKTIVLYSRNSEIKEEVRNFVREKLVSKFLPYIANDIYNYIRWMLKRNDRELFLKKEK
jgi:hypothetical protein